MLTFGGNSSHIALALAKGNVLFYTVILEPEVGKATQSPLQRERVG